LKQDHAYYYTETLLKLSLYATAYTPSDDEKDNAQQEEDDDDGDDEEGEE